MKRTELLMPKYRFRAVIDITADDLRKMGAKAVGLDIDNTIAPDGTMNFTEGIREWIESITESGFIISQI